MYQIRMFYGPDPAGYPPASSPGGMQSPWANAAPSIANGLFDVIGGLLGNRSQRKAQQKNMEYQNEWAYRQREWAIQDRDYQNWYNSPAELRKRMVAAGMNPALAYGGGNLTTASQQPRSVQTPSAPFAPLDTSYVGRGGSRAIDSYYDIRFKDAQLQQMELQNKLILANIENKNTGSQLNIDRSRLTVAQAQKVQTWLDGAKEFADAALGDNVYGNQLGYQATQMHLEVLKSNTAITNMINENDRRDLYQAKNAEMVAARIGEIAIRNAKTEEEIKLIRENIELLKKSGVLKDIDIDGARFLQKNFGGVAGQLLNGLLRRADVIR